jgi:hypothetical protein
VVYRLVVYLALAASPLNAQVVVNDPVQNSLQGVNNAVLQAHATFMKLQLVQDAEIVKNNFIQGEQYYNYIDQRSKHRGGLMGYYQEMVANQVNQIVTQEELSLETNANNVTGANLVNDLASRASITASAVSSAAIAGAAGGVIGGMQGADALYGSSNLTAFNGALQKTSATRAVQFQRNVSIANSAGAQITASNTNVAGLTNALNELKKEAAANSLSMDDNTFESLQLSIQAVQGELAVETHHLTAINAQLMKAMLDNQNIDDAFSRQTGADFNGYLNSSAQRRASSGTNSQSVITELNRQPK